MTQPELGSRACVHELFHRQAEARPEAIAVIDGDRHLTYQELDRRANRVACELREVGVGPETVVGVCVTRSIAAVVTLLGVLKAGGAYLPLDPEQPDDRLSSVCENSGALLVVTDAPERAYGVDRVIQAVGDGDDPADGPLDPPADVGVGPENLAYVVYTSGSTGAPKGVMVAHANVIQLLASTRNRFDFSPDDVWTLFASLAFDVSVWEMWGALLHGGRLVIVSDAVRRSPEEFYALVARERATVVNLTPAAFRQLSRHEEQNEPDEDLALRWIILAGESLTPAMLRAWFQRHGDHSPGLVNMYGITETTVHSTWRRMTVQDLSEPESSLIGLPLASWTAVVIGEDGQPVGPMETGELYVGGAGVARGYVGMPELTATRFVPDPTTGAEGARLYRSGDRVRVRAEGELEYLGRLDHQVKLRGYRIELGEVESTLKSHPDVDEAIVVLDETGAVEPRLIAYWTLASRKDLLPEDLRAHLSRTLPAYMLPGAFVSLERLPLTANGKVDRASLPTPAGERPLLSVPWVAPRTPLQKELAQIWTEVLAVDDVGLDDEFFELGGHSMLAVQVIALAHERFGLEISLRSVFDSPTVRLLSEYIAGTSADQPYGLAATTPAESR